jgi:Tfp pilus assembly protein PilF
MKCTLQRLTLSLLIFLMLLTSINALPHPSSILTFALKPVPVTVESDSCKVKLDKKTEKIYQEGIDYLKKRSYNLAGQQMRIVIKAEPACVDAYFVLGLVNFKKQDNNFKEALKNFLKVVELCPGYDVYVYYYLG